MKKETEYVQMRTEPFELMIAWKDQQVQDYKNHLDFQFAVRKQEMENTVIEAEAKAEFNFQMARSSYINPLWKVLLFLSIVSALYLVI